MNLNKFFESLASNASRNFKIEQLQNNSDNKTLREVVRLALDPFTQFYIRKIPSYTRGAEENTVSLEEAIDSLFELSQRILTGNAGIEHLRNILSNVTADDAKVIERIIQKDLKCGVQVSTANAVWSGLIHEYPVMLCSPFEQKLVDKIAYPAYVQLKMDGMRFNAIVRNGKVEFRSRNGKEIQLLGNLEKQFSDMAGDVDCVFDGELVVKKHGIILDRQTGNGILNKANKGTISKDEASLVCATVWDVIPYLYFVDGYCPTPYSTRFESLKLLLETHKPTRVSLVESMAVTNYEVAKQVFEAYLAEGQEGIILKDMSGVWEDKRAKHQIKFKGELECDLEVVGYEEGTGKYAGKLGALLLASRQGDTERLTVSVGSGFSDSDRDTLWAERDSIIGKIVAVKYNQKIKNKKGELSLFLPIVLELREDKDIADEVSSIK